MQKESSIDFAVIGYSGGPLSIPGLHIIPWTLRFSRWGPRRGGDYSQEPKVKASWDGRKLIYVKAPGESFSVLFVWTLIDPDELLVEGIEWHSIPFDFDFKETSIPSAYTRSKHYYRRVGNVVDWSPLPDGKPVTVQLSNEGLKVTCKVTTCLSFEITGGRRVSSQSYGSGHTFEPPLWHQTTIEFPGAN
jgi:hypothetical protein